MEEFLKELGKLELDPYRVVAQKDPKGPPFEPPGPPPTPPRCGGSQRCGGFRSKGYSIK